MSSKKNIVLLAGNGFIGQATSRCLSVSHHSIIVHHTGTRDIYSAPNIQQIIVPPKPLPILSFPKAVIDASRGGVVIHFQCMGTKDGEAFVSTFDGIAKRLVLISSCDVYLAYGRFIKSDSGLPVSTPLEEAAQLRRSRNPYKNDDFNKSELVNWYDKIWAEEALLRAKKSEVTVLRLPKVYGEESNADLGTVYEYAEHNDWRWTHGYVENIAAAIACAATHSRAKNEIFNLGEAITPSMGERLERLPVNPNCQKLKRNCDFRQDLHINTSKIRNMLGFRNVIDESVAMHRTAQQIFAKQAKEQNPIR